MPHLRIGWRAFQAQPGVFFISMLMMFALWVALELVVFSIQRHFTLATWLGIAIWTVLHLAFLVVFSGLAAGLVVISGEVLSGREARLQTLFGSMKRGPQVLLALCLYLLGVVAGLVLLVVPGIYFAVRYAMFGQVVATREVSAVESLHSAGALSNSRWRTMCGFWMRVWLLNLAGAAFLGVGLLLTVPVSLLASVSYYRSLVQPAAPSA
jgi:hypothetical protein